MRFAPQPVLPRSDRSTRPRANHSQSTRTIVALATHAFQFEILLATNKSAAIRSFRAPTMPEYPHAPNWPLASNGTRLSRWYKSHSDHQDNFRLRDDGQGSKPPNELLEKSDLARDAVSTQTIWLQSKRGQEITYKD